MNFFRTELIVELPKAIFLAISIFVLLFVFQFILGKKMKYLTSKTPFAFDDAVANAIDSIKVATLLIIALYFAVKPLPLPVWANQLTSFFFLFAVFAELVKITEAVILVIISKTVPDESSLHAIKLAVRIVLWTIGILMILSNIGFNVTSLIASLGIGGLAISLALQNVFQDLFSSFSILIDKPFEVGDMIVLSPEYSGTVERIGFKTTRLRTLQGEQLVVPNSQLTNQKVQNFKKLEERRVVTVISVTYETNIEKLKKIPAILESIIQPVKNATFGRAHLQLLADSSLNYELVYFVKSSEYIDYVSAEQSINLGIIEEFNKEGIEFAYPTQTVFVQNEAKS